MPLPPLAESLAAKMAWAVLLILLHTPMPEELEEVADKPTVPPLAIMATPLLLLVNKGAATAEFRVRLIGAGGLPGLTQDIWFTPLVPKTWPAAPAPAGKFRLLIFR